MKTLLALAFITLAPQCPAQDQLGDMLRKAIVEEDVNHNLDAAIKQYRAIIERNSGDRATAATALFRLAECNRKLGRTSEADAAYNRLITQFPEQTALVERSRKLRNTEVSAKPPADTAEMAILRQKYDLAIQQLQMAQRAMELGANAPADVEKAQAGVVRAQLAMLEQQTAKSGPAAETLRRQRRALVEQLIAIAQKALAEEEHRYQLGAAGQDAVNKRKSEVLDLQLELSRVEKK
jgi:tetratricopeptide (TPR) repeat protein